MPHRHPVTRGSIAETDVTSADARFHFLARLIVELDSAYNGYTATTAHRRGREQTSGQLPVGSELSDLDGTVVFAQRG